MIRRFWVLGGVTSAVLLNVYVDYTHERTECISSAIVSHQCFFFSPLITFSCHHSRHKCLGFSSCGLFLYALFNKTNKCSLWTCIQPSDFDVVSL